MDKKEFIKKVTILIDTREKENKHIIDRLNDLNVKYEVRKLDFADYSFLIDDRDFSQSCVIERKANVDELYGNVMHDRTRIEKEFFAMSRLANQCVLIVENCPSQKKLKEAKVSDRDMEKQNRKVKNIGEHCYNTIRSWQCGNRYNFRTIFLKDNMETAVNILEEFWWYYRNYKKLTGNRYRYK
ncbi:ERCC4 domain-containing protein [Cellulosilyticum sp. ST5]|uniref:ERCC4 domain-containing protein n=1 Tax=Cellulosilyticum sp. ST5 TaxID=3055805 RepID=UPI0039773BA4